MWYTKYCYCSIDCQDKPYKSNYYKDVTPLHKTESKKNYYFKAYSPKK